MKKRKIVLALCLALLLSTLSPMALAAEVETPADDPVDPAPYIYIHTISIDLKIPTGGKADCYSSVYIPDQTKTCRLSMQLQQRPSGSTDDDDFVDYGSMWTANGSDTVTLDQKFRYVDAGYTYRLLIGVTVYNSAGLICESTNALSNYVTY